MPGLHTDSVEHKAIRESVAGIVSRYGPEYFLERGRTGGGIEELWKDLGASGLLGVHLPEEYGGGGGGMAEAVVVAEAAVTSGSRDRVASPDDRVAADRISGPVRRTAPADCP